MPKEITTPSEVIELAGSFRISRIILTAFDLDVFSLLEKTSLTSAEIARQLGLDHRATDRFLNALVATGLLLKSSDSFSNTPFSCKHMVKGKPGYMSGLAHQVHLWKSWSSLTEALKAGTSVAVDKPIAERDAHWLESFIAAMHFRGIPQSKETADLLDLKEKKNALDVGGGSGAFLFEFIRRNPFMNGVVFDLPAVTPITRKYIEKEGFAGKVTTRSGDYLVDDFGTGYDLVFVSAVIHINSPAENLLLIRKCTDSLIEGGQLVILDHIMNDDRTEPVNGALFALNMLVGTLHGDTYTESETRQWMELAGLHGVHRKDSPSGINLMIGIK